jgi:hypothetical protein
LSEEVPKIPERLPTTTNTTLSSRDSSLFSGRSLVPSWRTPTSDLPPLSSPRHSIDSSDAVPKQSQDRLPERFHLPWLPPTLSTSHFPSNVQDGFKSPESPASMMSTSTVSLKPISVKAYLTQGAFVVFRVAHETTYAEIYGGRL